jgi:excisionase family DNA binding protein
MVNLMTEQDVSKRLNVSLGSLRRWRLTKRGPAFVKIGSLVRYSLEDLEAWLASLPTGGATSDKQMLRTLCASNWREQIE